MKRKNNYLFIALIIAAAAVLFAGCSSDKQTALNEGQGQGQQQGQWEDQRQGRQVTADAEGPAREWESEEHGPVEVIEGTLTYGDPEWYLDTDETTYQLGLGNPAYLESLELDLEDGTQVTVKGFMLDDEISVVSLTVDDREVAFRTDDGVPMWSGRGAGAEGQSSRGGGRGRGRSESVEQTAERGNKNS